MSEPSPEPRPSRWFALIPILLVLAFGGVLWALDPGFYWIGDYQLWYAPMFEEITRAWHAGDWPILTQGTWAAGNLAGEYQCGTFSVFFNGALALLWNLPLTIAGKAAVLSIAHLGVLAAGVYLLARRHGLQPAFATVATLVASLNGWLLVWAATDWFGALAGFVWVPWLWWSLLAAPDDRRQRWLLPPLFTYLLISAGNPYAVVMGALVSVYQGLRALIQARRQLLVIAFAWLIGVGLTAPAWLALLDLMHGSVREGWGPVWQQSWKVPWAGWAGLLLPAVEVQWCDFFQRWVGHISIEMAGGLVPLIALLVAAAFTRGRFIVQHKALTAFLVVMIALASAPGYSSFRWSFRLLPLFFLILGLAGATALQELRGRSVAITAFIATGGAWALATAFGACSDHRFALVQLVIMGGWIATSHLPLRWSTWSPAAAVFACLFVAFTLLPTTQKVSRHKFTENLRTAAPLETDRLYLSLHEFGDIIDEVAAKPGFGAILRPTNTAHLAGLHFLNGYTSFSPPGVPMLFQTHGSLDAEKIELLLSPASEQLLDLLGVDGVVISRKSAPLALRYLKSGWQLAHLSEEGNVYHRWPRRSTACKALPTLFDRPGETFAQPAIHIRESRRQQVRVEVEAEQSGLPIALAFPRSWFRGYEATLNGQPVPTRAYFDLIPLVELPAGSTGIVELRYRPMFLRWGVPIAGVSIAVWLSIGLIAGWGKVRRK